MKRKAGQLIPLEQTILDMAKRMQTKDNPEFYGYQIIGYQPDAGKIYRALNRLEKMGYLSSRWDDPNNQRKQGTPRRKFYKLVEGVKAK